MVVLEKTLESPLDCKEIKPVHPKGNQSWIFIGRTDVVVETPILWLPDAKNGLIGKDLNAGKDWTQEEKGMTRVWDGWMASLTQWTGVWLRKIVKDREAWHAALHGVAKSQIWQQMNNNNKELKGREGCFGRSFNVWESSRYDYATLTVSSYSLPGILQPWT